MTPDRDRPETLAAALASRILHDLAGPASGVASGLELQADPAHRDVREEARALAGASVTEMLQLLAFFREAFGGAGEVRDSKGLEALAKSQFKTQRTRLDWAVETPPPPGAATQALLILVQVAAGGLARGGTARATIVSGGGGIEIRVEGVGVSAQVTPEAVDGLGGRPLSQGLSGRWAPARYLYAVIAASGGTLQVETFDTAFALTARIPDHGADSLGAISAEPSRSPERARPGDHAIPSNQ